MAEFGKNIPVSVAGKRGNILAHITHVQGIPAPTFYRFEGQDGLVILNRKIGDDATVTASEARQTGAHFGESQPEGFNRLSKTVLDHFQRQITLGNTGLKGDNTAGIEALVIELIVDVVEFILTGFVQRCRTVTAQSNDVLAQNGITSVGGTVIAILVWRRESDVAAGGVIIRQQLKGDRNPGNRRLIEDYLDENAARRKCQIFGAGDRAVVVVEINGKTVLTAGLQIRQGALFAIACRNLRAFALRERLGIQGHHVVFNIDIKRLGARHAAIGCYQVDIFGFAKVCLSPATACKPRNATHYDALPGFVTGVFERQPGRRVGQGIVKDVLATVSPEVVGVLNAEIGKHRGHAENGGLIGIFFRLAAREPERKQGQKDKLANGMNAGVKIGAHGKIRFNRCYCGSDRRVKQKHRAVYTPLQNNAMVANLLRRGSARVLRFG